MSSPTSASAAMRIVSMAIMGYDFIITIPSEIRLYRRQKSMMKPSLPCVLFMLARYIGLIYIMWSTFVFFGPGPSLSYCKKTGAVSTTFRAVVSTISCSVFMWRTWAIWGRDRRIVYIMGTMLIPVTFFSYVPAFSQKPVFSNEGGCSAVSSGDGPLHAKWTFALVNLLYDTMACLLSSWRLIWNVRHSNALISSILLADGLAYFFIAVAIQLTNLIFLLSPDPKKQGTLQAFQTILTAILAQKIITALHERTSILPGSDWNDSDRSRSRNRERSRTIWAKPPPPSTWMSGPTHPSVPIGKEMGSQVSYQRPPPVEMMKIAVDVDQHVKVDRYDEC